MSHSIIQYVKPTAKIGIPGSASTLATARKPSTAGKPVTAGPPATGNPQEFKGRQQQQECLPQSGFNNSSDTSNNSNASNNFDSSTAEKNYSPIAIVWYSDRNMSHSTIQYVKPPVKIGTPGSAGMLATARTHSTAGKPAIAGPPATACSTGTAEMPTTPLVTPRTSAIVERPVTGNPQELKGRQQQQEFLPQSGCKK
jgi:hypothetical protein